MKTAAAILALLLFSAGAPVASAAGFEGVELPAPFLERDKPLMQTLKERRSSRTFSEKQLSLQDLSNLLWCANGVNRPDTGNRTSPSARNRQDVDIYAVLKEGVYLYAPKTHELLPVVRGDYRSEAGAQPFVGTAPLNLIYVSDTSRLDFVKDPKDRAVTAALDAGHCSQNVYLYGAAAGLSVVARTSVDGVRMAAILRLRPGQLVLMGQTVGYPG
ncbi:MAG TPA: SagB/ThcOx family dehydrogenase [Syntrophales bacterium]|jgi:SagB-type dehydrogenase family enzyme|nr:SagB/ThcOx family dehydrogenase [Syntrophales bacterium]